MDDYVNAVRDYQAAIRLDASYALSYYNAGNIYFKQRQFKQVCPTPPSFLFVLYVESTWIVFLFALGAELLW